jgi:ABC-type lipoprotein release transport system permease subunit
MRAIMVTFKLGLHDLFSHYRLVLVMALTVAIATSLLAVVEAYRLGLAAEFNEQIPNLLLVQESQISGEIYGSRISSQVGLLRGIDLGQYTRLETFSMVSGRSLVTGDSPRQAMIGLRLAESRHLMVGESISLRGRYFDVIGIFQNGTYMDNQAWISLAAAQALLGWGQDVSAYVIPDEGIIHEGDSLPGGLSVTRKGESVRLLAAQYELPIVLLRYVALALGVAAALSLTNILWRLTWARRREMAILRTIGFSTVSLAGYLLAQAGGIILLGILIGSFFTVVFILSVRLTVTVFTIVPRLDAPALLPSLGWIGLMMLAGCLLPAWWLSRLNLARLLHSE